MIQPDALRRHAAPAFRGLAGRSLGTVRFGSAGVFLLSFVGYVAAGALLVFRGGVIVPDAWARIGNAAWMITSRDPHFAAIGFVWNPLPSLMTLPFIAVRDLWPPLVSAGFAGNLVTAGFMAGAVVLMARIAADLGVHRAAAGLLVALFALHPMILLYGSNGMSEAPFVFFLLFAVRHFIAWWRTGSTYQLTATGLALSLAYLTRYEAVAAAAAVLLAVGLRAYLISAGGRRARASWAAADLLVVGLPVGFTFIGWAVASWVITGHPFETFTSIYGNSSQVALAGSSISAVTGRGVEAFGFSLGEILGLAPGLPVLIGVVAVLALIRRRSELFAPLAVFGGVLAFSILTAVGGASFAWLRFSITAIPLSIVVALLALSSTTPDPSGQTGNGHGLPTSPNSPGARSPRERLVPAVARIVRIGLAVAILAVVALSLPVGLGTMRDPRVGREEAYQVRALIQGADPSSATLRQSAIGLEAASYIDALALPDGSVIVDVALGFPIVLQSSRPRTFVITPDRDFERILSNPTAFSTQYVLVPTPAGYAGADAVGRAYPSMFQDGAGIAQRVAEFGSAAFAWRLYRLD